MIVVVDTNVWVSALAFGRFPTNPRRAIERALRRDTLASCAEIEAEIRRVLIEKFAWHDKDAERILGAYFTRAFHVSLRHSVHVCRDPSDDMVLECAVLAKAGAIVSGDKDLLVLGSYEGIRILTAAEYVALRD